MKQIRISGKIKSERKLFEWEESKNKKKSSEANKDKVGKPEEDK